MRQFHLSKTMLAGLMALVLALIAVLQPGATMAQTALIGQASSPQTVGDSTVSFTDDWSFDPSLSSDESVLLLHQQLTGTLFLYSEFAEPGTTDPAVVVDEFAGGFFSEFGDGNQQTVASGIGQAGSAWELFTVEQSGIPFGLILIANVSPNQTGVVAVSVLLAPRGSFDLATQAAIDGIDLNGTGSPLNDFSPAELSAALSGASQPNPTQTPEQAQPEETATQTSGGLTLPPLNPTQTPEQAQPEETATQTSGGLTLPPLNPTQTPEQAQPEETATQTSGGLTLPPLNPTQTPEQAQPEETATQTSGGLTLPPLNPTQTPEQAQPEETATQTSGGLTLPPLNPTQTPDTSTGGQATDVGEITVGDVVLRHGEGWTYSEEISTPNETAFFSRDSSTLALYAFASVANTEGDDAITGLQDFNSGFFSAFGAVDVRLVESEVLPSGVAYSVNSAVYNGLPITVLAYADVTSVPGEFRVQVLIALADEFDATLSDARGALQINDVVVFSDLDPAAISGQPDTGAVAPSTTTPAETQPVVDISQYQAQDAPDTCDSIGWVVTSAEQMPVTEQDINFRSTCVGGGTYFAVCGLAEGNQFFAPETGMQWVRCDVAFRPDSESLGVSFIDFAMIDGNGTKYTFDLLGMAALENGVDFPDGPVEGGQTASGSVVFSVPEGASTPLVLEVAPFALLAGGGEPGTLVIADALQPFETLGL